MKKIILIASFVLSILTACNQNNTNPNTNNNTCTPANDVFYEITINGTTYHSNGYIYSGLKRGIIGTIVTDGNTSIFNLQNQNSLCQSGYSLGNLSLELLVEKIGGATTTGVYSPGLLLNGNKIVVTESTLGIKVYTFKDSTLFVNITNISNGFISGSFSAIVKDAINEYPATGSFNVIRLL